MKKLLEDLWYSYQMEKPLKRDDEKNKILDALIMSEKKLLCTSHKLLTVEHIAIFSQFEKLQQHIAGD